MPFRSVSAAVQRGPCGLQLSTTRPSPPASSTTASAPLAVRQVLHKATGVGAQPVELLCKFTPPGTGPFQCLASTETRPPLGQKIQRYAPMDSNRIGSEGHDCLHIRTFWAKSRSKALNTWIWFSDYLHSIARLTVGLSITSLKQRWSTVPSSDELRSR